MKTICKKLIGAAVIAVLLGVNYAASAVAAEMNHDGMMSADLRTGLNSLFREHRVSRCLGDRRGSRCGES